MSFFEELKRRNVFRVGFAYGVAAWLLIQLSDILVPLLGLPESVQKVVLLLLIIGFIPALIFAWAFELTPEGIRKEKDVDRSQSIAPQTGSKLDRTIIVILALAVAFLLYRQLGQEPVNEAIAPSTAPGTAQSVGSEAQIPTAAASAQKKSVAVLPFVNMSSDPEQEYFSDGLSEELLNRLAKNEQLQVAARTSAFQFKGQNLDITDIGNQLKVANILEGSVRKAGNRLRITAQLIQVSDGFHLWSETYEREMDDVFAIQDEIALAISEALEAELGATAQTSTATRPTRNMEAYNHYLRARYLLAQRGGENMLLADELFAKAVALDPDFTAAWSGKAFNAALLWHYDWDTSIETSLEKTREAADHAIALDPGNAEAYTALGRVLSINMQWQEAQANYERAYELDPNDVGVINLYGDFLGFRLGDLDRAIKLKQQAVSLDPLSGVHASDLADLLLARGRFEEALASARRGVSLAPDSIQRMGSLLRALVVSGHAEEAKELIERVSAPGPEHELFKTQIQEWWAFYYYGTNDLENLQKRVAECEDSGQSESAHSICIGPALMAFFSLDWKEPADVVPWLEIALEELDFKLTAPMYFYLPERISNDSRWLEFWNQPVLKELLDFRRSHPYPPIGVWKGRHASNEAAP